MVELERAFIGLGTNVGEPRASLSAALAALEALPAARLLGVSRLYRTRPVGPVPQADFHNAVAELGWPTGSDVAGSAMALLVALKGIERDMGRVSRERWGPREIDLDLLLLGEHRLRLEREPAARSFDPGRVGVGWLEVPHPATRDRLFVLAPLADLAASLEPPGWGEHVAAARDRAQAIEGEDAVQVVGTWDQEVRGWLHRA